MIPDINLLPRRERQRDRSMVYLIVFGILIILSIIFIVTQFFILSKNINALESEKEILDLEREALREELDLLDAPKAFDLETAIQFIEDVSYPVTPIIVELNRYLNDHSYLRSYSFSEDKVAFSVDFETVTEVALYVEDLMKSPFVTDVIVNNMSTFDPAEVEEDERFEVSDRFANTFEVLLDLTYLGEIGGEGR